MTECALPQPVMLNMNPSTSTNNIPHSVFTRRSSLRRGTISSLSKDIRVNDFVEIIKKQKAIQQQERQAAQAAAAVAAAAATAAATAALIEENNNAMLRRRHSMLNMYKTNNNNRAPSTTKTLRSRNRTVSNADFRNTNWQQVSQNNNKKAPQKYDATDKIRLETEQQQTTLYHQHLRKCSACVNHYPHEDDSSSCSSTCSSNEDEEEQLHRSPSTSTTSSTASSNHIHRPFLNPKDTCSSTTSFLWQPTIINNDANTNKENMIIHDLNSTMNHYTHQMKALTFNKHNPDYKYKIKECKALVAHQQHLLSQLEAAVTEQRQETKPTAKSVITKKGVTMQDILKSWTLPKSVTTKLIIKQKADKNQLDTIITVGGVCTTIESSLIPDRLLLKNDMTTFNQVYQYNYTIDITYNDRLNKFKLLPMEQWQPDSDTHICSFKQCKQEFNWFQRKHHCRGCGQIYCKTHSGNRLPLFDSNKVNQPVFSRVCDKCFYSLVGDSLL